MALVTYQKKNNAKTTITNNPLAAGDLSITLASSTGDVFPAAGVFLATIWTIGTYPDPGDDPGMEIVKIDSRSGDTLTVNASGRGFGGTAASSHATGSTIALLMMKEHFDEYDTILNGGIVSENISASAAIPYSKLTLTNSIVAGDITSNAVTTAKILDANVTNAKLASGAVTAAKITAGTITATELASNAITTVKITDGNVTAAKIATGTITATQLASNAVTTVKITDANVTTAKIADANVTTAKIADGAVTDAKTAFTAIEYTGQNGAGYIDNRAQGSNPSAPAAGYARMWITSAYNLAFKKSDNTIASVSLTYS